MVKEQSSNRTSTNTGNGGKGKLIKRSDNPPGSYLNSLTAISLGDSEEDGGTSSEEEDEYEQPSEDADPSDDQDGDYTSPETTPEPPKKSIDVAGIATEQFGEDTTVSFIFHNPEEIEGVDVQHVKTANAAPDGTATPQKLESIRKVLRNSFQIKKSQAKGSKTLPRAVVAVIPGKPGKEDAHRIVALKEESIIMSIMAPEGKEPQNLKNFATTKNVAHLIEGARDLFEGCIGHLSPSLAAKFCKAAQKTSTAPPLPEKPTSKPAKKKKAEPRKESPKKSLASAVQKRPQKNTEKTPQKRQAQAPGKRPAKKQKTLDIEPDRSTLSVPKKAPVAMVTEEPSVATPVPSAPKQTVAPSPRPLGAPTISDSHLDLFPSLDSIEAPVTVEIKFSGPVTKVFEQMCESVKNFAGIQDTNA